MDPSLEAAVGRVGRHDQLPGTRGDSDRVRFVSFTEGEKPSKLFDQVLWKVDPPLVTDGGASLANVVLATPDRTSFFAIEIGTGDLARWQAQIEGGAQLLGRRTGKIDNDCLNVSDGGSFRLGDCRVSYEPLSRRS